MNDILCTKDGQRLGPVSKEELDRLIARGDLGPEDRVLIPPSTEWMTVRFYCANRWTPSPTSQPERRPRSDSLRVMMKNGLILIAILGGLAAIGILSFHQARLRSFAGSTLGGLRMLDAAMDQYALEHQKSPGDKVRMEDVALYVTNYMRRYEKPVHPYLKGINTPFGDEFLLSAIGAPPKLPYPTWKKIVSVVDTNFFGLYPIETEAEYKARLKKTVKN